MLLWKSVVSNKLLAHVSIILFLNKVDLLQVCCSLISKQGDDADMILPSLGKAQERCPTQPAYAALWRQTK